MPRTCNHREQLYSRGSFFRRLYAREEEEEVTKPAGQPQLVKYYYWCVFVCVYVSVHI